MLDTESTECNYVKAYARPTRMEFIADKLPLLAVVWETGHLTIHKVDSVLNI